ncbi:F0F1 ATP synthase subunit delta [[Mycoplasma] mobile]|uniref:ATP synthase subunit delta n=1 Tax=Mycoplasma mobile (strain ATCC 43663 / 163K / NCTC 11711) TaxID=267748 RepID=ATPD_MYCM1|nr:F0F1 ATP synthase subunit delta [[Mycoplasma] mobile]Q6KI78.1 RecName: Full=ATP synthase subunit delta; AltName: Full=ATP synthase F(1) sector subunit delta; AltName: Full=F-type ATPase subunit delta; Short=F-ATPase subunit delta [Mycoplasma mobile 163K]AAT27698.1 ATP synthase delta chain [Mycoplasma mobile 163K]
MISQNNKGYALALFEIANEELKLEQYFQEVKKLNEIINENEDLVKLLSSKEIQLEKKLKILENIFTNHFTVNINNFLKLIITNNLFIYIKSILKIFLDIASKKLNISYGKIYSSKKLDEKIISNLEKFYSDKLSKKVEMLNLIDTTLIKGIRIEIENTIHENSIKNNIKELQKSILEKEQ